MDARPDPVRRSDGNTRRLAVSEVGSTIGRVRMRIRLGVLATGAARLLGWLTLVLVILGLLDLSIGLGTTVRLWATLVLVAIGVGAAVAVFVRLVMVSRQQAAARLDSALLQHRAGATGSEARSTLEFGDRTGASDLLSRTFAKAIAQNAADRLDGFRTRRVRTGYSTGRAMAVCAGILLVLGAGQIFAGDVMASVGRRLLDPAGGHPRWSPIGVDIEVERVDPSASSAKAGIWAGDSVRVSARIGTMPEQTRAVLMVRREGSEAEPIPLDAVAVGPDGAGVHEAGAVLRSVSEPMRVWVEVRGGPGTPQRWRASSREIVIEPEQRPRLRGARLTVRPPGYTGLPERSVSWPGRVATTAQPVEVPQGTELVVDGRGAISLSDLRASGMTAQVQLSADEARASWTESEPGEREAVLSLIGHDGRGDAVRMDLTVLEDAPPSAMIAWPRREEVVALEGAVVPVRVAAEDDYGVQGATLRAVVVDDPERALEAELEAGSKRVAGGAPVGTTAIGAVAGDVIEVRLVAADNRPHELGGSQPGESRVLRILVVGEEEFAAMLESEIGKGAADAFREQQEGAGGEPCPDCGGAECQGSCDGGGNGAGSGSGGGAGAGGGPGDGGRDGQGSPEGDGSEAGQGGAQPWRGDRFFDGRESEAPSAEPGEGAPSERPGGGAPSGSGGVSDDGSRTRAEPPPVEQPATPAFAEEPDGRIGGASTPEDHAPIAAEAEASVPERYRDLVRAYYRQRSKGADEGDQP